jgi:hypothetical protein
MRHRWIVDMVADLPDERIKSYRGMACCSSLSPNQHPGLPSQNIDCAPMRLMLVRLCFRQRRQRDELQTECGGADACRRNADGILQALSAGKDGLNLDRSRKPDKNINFVSSQLASYGYLWALALASFHNDQNPARRSKSACRWRRAEIFEQAPFRGLGQISI